MARSSSASARTGCGLIAQSPPARASCWNRSGIALRTELEKNALNMAMLSNFAVSNAEKKLRKEGYDNDDDNYDEQPDDEPDLE